jgi:hypothetical protein
LSKQFLAIMRKTGIGNESADTGGRRQLSRLSFHALRAAFNSGLHNKGVDQELRRKLTAVVHHAQMPSSVVMAR